MPREDRQKLVFRQLSSTILNMGFFDGLEREGLIAPTGYIRKCMNDRIGGVEIDNLLLDMFLNESSEHAATFTNAQKGEFIFHIFDKFDIVSKLDNLTLLLCQIRHSKQRCQQNQ